MRIVIADDSVLLREGVARVLAENGFEVVAQVGDAAALERAVRNEKPDVAIVDVRMPPTHTDEGTQAAVRIRAEHPEVGVLVLSQVVEARHALTLFRDSPEGFGYLLKDRVVDVAVLVGALETVRAGGTVMDPDVIAHLLGRQSLAAQLERLSKRELTVLELMAQGYSNAGIGEQLVIETKTVESHVARIMAKLDLHQAPEEHRRVRAVLAWLRG